MVTLFQKMSFARIYITSCTCEPCVRCNVKLRVEALILEGLSLIYSVDQGEAYSRFYCNLDKASAKYIPVNVYFLPF